VRLQLAAAVALVIALLPAAAYADARAQRETAFLRTVNPHNTANVVTGDLTGFTGTHVAYRCEVDSIVRPGVILGQCGSDVEPMDLFVELPTANLKIGDRLRVLGILDRPGTWSDITGHTVYYAFLRALFVDRAR
jgi:hypothetical protein